MKINMRTGMGAVAMLLASALAAACGASNDGQVDAATGPNLVDPPIHAEEPNVQRDAILASLQYSISPLSELIGGGTGHLSSFQYNVLEEQLTLECLTEGGWQFWPVVGDPAAVQPLTSDGAVEWARATGYGLLQFRAGDPSISKNARNANEGYLASLSEEELAEYNLYRYGEVNDHSDGCQGAITAKLDQVFPFDDQALPQEAWRAREAVQQTPEYLKAASKWSACMSARSFDFKNSADARASFNAVVESARPSQGDLERERAVAVADAECSVDSVWPVANRLELEQVSGLLDEFGADNLCGTLCLPTDPPA